MNTYKYKHLTHKDEIRIFELLPGRLGDDLRGHMKHIRIPPTSLTAGNVFGPDSNNVWRHDIDGLSFTTKIQMPNGKWRVVRETQVVYTCERAPLVGGYDALSYTWGSSFKTNKIDINGAGLPITRNLDAAFRGVRSATAARLLWVDAICIDQNNVGERNHQVNVMKRIFSNASSVIVWLGETPPKDPTVEDLILTYNFVRLENPETNILSYPKDSLVGLRQLFSWPWWKRVWIVQEVVAANEIVVRYGGRFIPWSFFVHVCQAIQASEFRAHPRAHILRTCGYRKFMALDNFRSHGAMLLIRLLQCTRDYSATDPRDKIYAMLGIAADVSPTDIVPDYTQSPEEVYLGVLRFMITTRGSLDIISSGRLALAVPGVPTWSPDWRVLDKVPPLSGEEVAGHRYSAGGRTTAVVDMGRFPSVLEVEGVLVDRVGCMGGMLKLASESMSTIHRWHYIAKENLKSELSASHRVDWTRLFAQTIIADKDHLGKQPSEGFLGAFWPFINGESPEKTEAVRFYADAVTRAVMGRRFFLTKGNRMALGPRDVQLGDMIVVLKGCSVPLVVRAVEGGVVLIGEAYVSGIMNGEVVADTKYRMTRITLR